MNQIAVHLLLPASRKKAHLLLVIVGFFFILAMHYWQAHPPGLGLWISFNISSWIPVGLLIGFGLFQIGQSGSIVYTRLSARLALCCVLLMIPFFYPASESLLDSGMFWGLLAGLLVLLSLQQFQLTRNEILFLFLLVLAGVWIEAVIAWSQFLGFDLSQSMQTELGTRPGGIFRQPNVLGSFLATGLALSGFLLRARNADSADSFRPLPLFLLLTPVLVLPLIVVLNSRTAWLGTLVVLVLLQPWLWQGGKNRTAVLWCVSAIAGLALGFLLIQLTGSFENSLRKVADAGPRSAIYPQVLRMALEQPLTGYGFGNFEAAYNSLTAQWFAEGIFSTGGHKNLSHAHNELLFWWVQGGILALAGLLLAAYWVLRAVFGIMLSGKAALALTLLALLFPITLHTQTEMPFYHSVPHWIVFIMVIFLVDHYSQEPGQVLMPAGNLFKVFAIIVPAAVTLFMVTALHSGALLTRYERNPSVNVSTLEAISNPLPWQDRLYWDLNTGLLALSIYENRPELALPYIQWATEKITETPRPGFYQYLVVAYRSLGDEASARAIMVEADYRFPDNEIDYAITRMEGIDRRFPENIETTTIVE